MIIWPAVLALLISLAVTPLVRKLAFRVGVVDEPGAARKIHRRATPLLGGTAVYLAFVLGISLAWVLGLLPGDNINAKNLAGLLLAGAILMVGGALDDRFDLKPRYQIIFPLLASVVVVTFGIGIDYVTNPLGGQLRLDSWEWIVLWWRGVPYKLTLPSDLFTVAWLLTVMYATKFADGLDGLVSGVTVIGALLITVVSFMVDASQPDTALVALVVVGAFLGFLRYNYNPASIFLGEGGSVLAGFLLGSLAIVSGGKIATAFLVLGLPLFDLVFTVLRRLAAGRSPFSADRLHLHFRLLDSGLSQRQAVMFVWFVSALAGVSILVFLNGLKLALLPLFFSLTTAVGAAILTRRRIKDRNHG